MLYYIVEYIIKKGVSIMKKARKNDWFLRFIVTIVTISGMLMLLLLTMCITSPNYLYVFNSEQILVIGILTATIIVGLRNIRKQAKADLATENSTKTTKRNCEIAVFRMDCSTKGGPVTEFLGVYNDRSA